MNTGRGRWIKIMPVTRELKLNILCLIRDDERFHGIYELRDYKIFFFWWKNVITYIMDCWHCFCLPWPTWKDEVSNLRKNHFDFVAYCKGVKSTLHKQKQHMQWNCFDSSCWNRSESGLTKFSEKATVRQSPLTKNSNEHDTRQTLSDWLSKVHGITAASAFCQDTASLSHFLT